MIRMRLEYNLSPRRVALVLGAIALCFALQSLVMEYLIENRLDHEAHATLIQVIDLFSVNAEQTIPTWYATLLLLGAAVVLAHITLAKRVRQESHTRYWGGLALIFLYLSIDEAAVIHEIASDAIQALVTTTGYLEFPWLIAALPLVLLFGLLYVRFLFHLPRRTALLFVLAGVIYIGGAMGIEAVSANQYSLEGGVTFPYLVISTMEELCEMWGIVVFIYALLSYAAEKQYSFAYIPTAQTDLNPLHESAPSNVYHVPSALFSRPLKIFAVLAVIGLNAALIAWALSQPSPSGAHQADNSFALELVIDQFPAEDVVMTRMIGRFGGDNLPARQMVGALLSIYEDVLVISLPNLDSSLAFAADELPFDQADVTEMLHAAGETQFVIFDTAAVRVFTGNLTTGE
jgi:hypothetical protein